MPLQNPGLAPAKPPELPDPELQGEVRKIKHAGDGKTSEKEVSVKLWGRSHLLRLTYGLEVS